MRNKLFGFCLLIGWGCLPLFSQPIDVLLIGGQSNATGQGYLVNLPAQFKTDQRVLIYYSKYLKQGAKSETWQPLCAASEDAERFGVELSLGTSLQQRLPKQKFAIIKHATSGSNLYQQWNPGNRAGQKQGEEYARFIATVKQGLEKLKKQGYTPRVMAMVWQQGESDGDEVAGIDNAKAYTANLTNLIDAVRQQLKAPEMLFVYGEVIPYPTHFPEGRKAIRDAQLEVCQSSHSSHSVRRAFLVEADDLQMRAHEYHSPYPQDFVHLGTYGVLQLGERFAEMIVEQQNK
ncbi:MAG: sialate O-acetylesterase [Bacteroidaceae bacterium]